MTPTGRTLRAAILAASTLAALAAGCGTPSADLFVIDRSGSLPGAKLHLLVNDGGEVQCDGGTAKEITSQQLLDARDLLRRMDKNLRAHTNLPRARGSLLRIRMTAEHGTLAFWDSSPGRTHEMARLLQLTRDIAMQACGRPR